MQRWAYGFALETFAAEVCAPMGMEPTDARKKLHGAALLITETRGAQQHLTYRRWVPGAGRVRLVAITPTIFDSGEDDAQVGAA